MTTLRAAARVGMVGLVAAASLACGIGAGRAGGSAPSVRVTPPAGFPVGPWTTTLTEADWLAAGISARDEIDQNSGEIVLDFGADGTWRSVQTSLTGVVLREPVLSGTYLVDGDVAHLTIGFPEHYRTEGVVDTVRWELIGDDELRLELVAQGDPWAGVVYGAHVWRRP